MLGTALPLKWAIRGVFSKSRWLCRLWPLDYCVYTVWSGTSLLHLLQFWETLAYREHFNDVDCVAAWKCLTCINFSLLPTLLHVGYLVMLIENCQLPWEGPWRDSLCIYTLVKELVVCREWRDRTAWNATPQTSQVLAWHRRLWKCGQDSKVGFEESLSPCRLFTKYHRLSGL